MMVDNNRQQQQKTKKNINSRRRGRGRQQQTTTISNGGNSSKTTNNAKRQREDADKQEFSLATPTTDFYPSHNSLLISDLNEEGAWYEAKGLVPEANRSLQENTQKNTIAIMEKYRTIADSIYRREVQLSSSNNTKDDRWVETTMRQGTLKDRIAAMSVVITTDPIHRMYALDGLLQMTGCLTSTTIPNARVAQMAAEALEDIFVNTLLPSKRKLLLLQQRPLHVYDQNKHKTLSPRLLLLWHYEQLVKGKFDLFCRLYLQKTLQESGTMEVHKISCIKMVSNFLRSVPEQESFLLRILINQLGSTNKKVASVTQHEIMHRLLPQHPAMKNVVAREIQQFVIRPHLSKYALYNAICCLNQIRLDKDHDSDLAISLISTYVKLFEVATTMHKKNKKKKQDDDDESSSNNSRLLSALLTGVDRAHPYIPRTTSSSDDVMNVDALYKVVHTAPSSGAKTQALLLLFHLTVGTTTASSSTTPKNEKETSNNNSSSDNNNKNHGPERFYRALYSTLTPTMLGTGKKLTMFYNLLYKAIKYDTDSCRILAFGKKILVMALHCPGPGSLAACLFLLSELCKEHPLLLTCYQQVLSGPDALRSLDFSKREPRGALVSPTDNDNDNSRNDEKRAPGWEVTLTMHHYHPSVQKFTESLANDGTDHDNNYTGDPLKDFSLGNFLDKFAYRNPKSAEQAKKQGQRRRVNSSLPPVNDPSFIERDQVDVQDEFFHKFFSERSKRDEAKGIVRAVNKKNDGDNQDELELDALDREEGNMDHSNYNDFEKEWETDEEEEAFVDSLALKMMEDSMVDHDVADLDDEDPVMGDWDDMYDEKDKNGDVDGQLGKTKESSGVVDNADLSDADDFMDNDNDSSQSSDEGSDQDEKLAFHNIGDASDNDEDSATHERASENNVDNDNNDDDHHEDDDDGGDDLAFANEDDDSTGDDEAPPLVKMPVDGEGTFASADDFEEMISSSMNRTVPNRKHADYEESEQKKPKKRMRKNGND